jgi:hypothetical protein
MAREAEPPPGGGPDLSNVPTDIPELQDFFDSFRPKRPLGYPKTGKEVWDRLIKGLSEQGGEYYAVLGNAQNLFSEAIQAFDGRAIEGASLICRATVEAACYLFLTNKPTKNGIREDFPLTMDGHVRQVQFEELKRAIARKRVLSQKQLKAMSRIQTNGNLIAHLASQHATQIRRFEKEVRRVNRYILSKKGLTDDQRVRIEIKVRSILRFWLDQEEVLDDLVNTASILLTFAKNVHFPTFPKP